ncbi:MAG: hypothetical protein EBR10_03500 [Planctomycetes bacterium]|nr:hypothetical protein [Planctomycetota bacterium]
MLISATLATELLLLTAASDQLAAAPRQDAVLVSYDRVARGSQTTLCVSTPITSEGGPVSLSELRAMVAVTERAVRSPRFELMVDNTIGGRSWSEYKQASEDAAEGGIAGQAAVPFNLRLLLTSGSIVPPSQLEGLTVALADVERYFEDHIQSFNITVTLRVAYVPITAGRLGFTTARYSIEKYSDVADALDRASLNELEDTPVPVRPSIPIRYSGVSTAATQENRVYVTRPLKLALGLLDAGGISAPSDDGTVSLNSAIQWDFNPQDGLRFGTGYLYSFQDHLIREVVQAMGFVAGADFLVRDCTVMDLFRFQADAIDPTYLIASNTNVFGGAPPVTCAQWAGIFEGGLLGGSLPPIGWALDYNPGLNKTLIANWKAVNAANTANQLLGAATAAVNDLPDPTEFLRHQIAGNPGANTNVFDDSEIVPAIPASQRTGGYPDGAVQTIATVGAGAGARCAIIDFRAKVPAVAGPPAVAQVNRDFRGAMPRTVARNTVANTSILNFMVDVTGAQSDYEFEMYDGAPVRGAFVKQDELGDLGTRCLLGKEIGRGVTFYSRDPCSYSFSPLDLAPLGKMPDFLTGREWLALDMFGWSVDLTTLDLTNEGDTTANLECAP